MKRSSFLINRLIIQKVRYFIILLPVYFLPLCTDDPSSSSGNYEYHVPDQIGDGWETASLSSVGMKENCFITLMNELESVQDHRIHSLLIIKNGKLVFEEYFQGEKFNLAQFTGRSGFDMDETHNLCSATKSFTSALIGIAIDMHFIKSVNKGIFDYFPEHSDLLASSPEKKYITIENLITMSSGIMWDDETYSYTDPRNDLNRMFNSSDPIRYVLSKDLYSAPGELFRYSNCNSNVLGEIVKKASGQRLDTFGENYLFSKLGIVNYEWQMMPNSVVFASGDLRLRPRDMAKFGLLFLNKGIWGNERIISEEWVEASTKKFFGTRSDVNGFNWADGYGYHWWQWESISGKKFNAYFAAGWGGQWIIVNPENNLIIVSTAGNYFTETIMPVELIITDFILPSIE